MKIFRELRWFKPIDWFFFVGMVAGFVFSLIMLIAASATGASVMVIILPAIVMAEIAVLTFFASRNAISYHKSRFETLSSRESSDTL